MSCPIRSGLVPLIQRSVQRGGVLSAAHHRTSTSMVCVRCFSSPPAGSPVMVGIPKEFTRGPEDKRLVNHSGEESIVSMFAWKHTFLFEMNSTAAPRFLVLCLSIYLFYCFNSTNSGSTVPMPWSWYTRSLPLKLMAKWPCATVAEAPSDTPSSTFRWPDLAQWNIASTVPSVTRKRSKSKMI